MRKPTAGNIGREKQRVRDDYYRSWPEDAERGRRVFADATEITILGGREKRRSRLVGRAALAEVRARELQTEIRHRKGKAKRVGLHSRGIINRSASSRARRASKLAKRRAAA